MNAILSGLTNLMNNPILVGVGSLLLIIAGFFLRKWIMPWLQKREDAKNKEAAEEQSKRSQSDNQKANEDIGKIFD